MAFDTILIVGCGNMAGAMLRGWLAAGVPADRFTVVDPAGPAVPAGVTICPTLPDGGGFDAVLLGIKPQLFDNVAADLAGLAGPATVVMSMLAGVELATLAQRLPTAGGYLRLMPNLAAAIGKSPIGLAEHGLDQAQRAAALELLAPLGTPEWIDEAQFDLVTALAGSGPAFVYRFIDALAAAAADLGMAPHQAQRLAGAMVEGAAALAAQAGETPAELARRVTSPGGTTAAGLAALDRDGQLATLVFETLRAARDRGAALAAAARRDG
jgi:pyrroline-5-carboxylate reductase